MNKQIEALKMAIEALENIFGWQRTTIDILDVHKTCKEALAEAEKQEFKFLTNYEIRKCWRKSDGNILDFSYAIEKALKEKNG